MSDFDKLDYSEYYIEKKSDEIIEDLRFLAKKLSASVQNIADSEFSDDELNSLVIGTNFFGNAKGLDSIKHMRYGSKYDSWAVQIVVYDLLFARKIEITSIGENTSLLSYGKINIGISKDKAEVIIDKILSNTNRIPVKEYQEENAIKKDEVDDIGEIGVLTCQVAWSTDAFIMHSKKIGCEKIKEIFTNYVNNLLNYKNYNFSLDENQFITYNGEQTGWCFDLIYSESNNFSALVLYNIIIVPKEFDKNQRDELFEIDCFLRKSFENASFGDIVNYEDIIVINRQWMKGDGIAFNSSELKSLYLSSTPIRKNSNDSITNLELNVSSDKKASNNQSKKEKDEESITLLHYYNENINDLDVDISILEKSITETCQKILNNYSNFPIESELKAVCGMLDEKYKDEYSNEIVKFKSNIQKATFVIEDFVHDNREVFYDDYDIMMMQFYAAGINILDGKFLPGERKRNYDGMMNVLKKYPVWKRNADEIENRDAWCRLFYWLYEVVVEKFN